MLVSYKKKYFHPVEMFLEKAQNEFWPIMPTPSVSLKPFWSHSKYFQLGQIIFEPPDGLGIIVQFVTKYQCTAVYIELQISSKNEIDNRWCVHKFTFINFNISNSILSILDTLVLNYIVYGPLKSRRHKIRLFKFC